MIFTMDDGYKDNYTNALPIFKKFNVPYTIFITTNFPDRQAILWWYVLEDLLLNNEEIILSDGRKYAAGNFDEKISSFMEIRSEILKLNQLNLKDQLNHLFVNYQINWESKCESLCLSWEDIKNLSHEPLVTLGAHTQHHYNLKQLKTEADIIQEVKSGIEIFYSHIGSYPTVFAYPFGSELEASIREFKTLSQIEGLELSVRSVGGFVTEKNISERFSLPRLMLTDKMKINSLKYYKDIYISH